MSVETVRFDSTRQWRPVDLLALHDEPGKHEILDGTLVVTPAASLGHNGVVARLSRNLHRQLPPGLLATTDPGVSVGESYRLPDVAIVAERAAVGDELTYPPGQILLAAEVISPSSKANDRFVKVVEYAQAGIPTYLVIDPGARPITVYQLGEGAAQYRISGTYGPGDVLTLDAPAHLRIPVDEVLD